MVSFTFNFRRLDHDFADHPAVTPLWSLCVEEQFYLLWPLVILLGKRSTRMTVCALLVVLGPLIRAALVFGLRDGVRDGDAIADTIYWLPVSHLDAFASGALVSMWLEMKPSQHAARWERASHLSAMSLLGVAGALNLVSMIATGYAGPSDAHDHVVWLSPGG